MLEWTARLFETDTARTLGEDGRALAAIVVRDAIKRIKTLETEAHVAAIKRLRQVLDEADVPMTDRMYWPMGGQPKA